MDELPDPIATFVNTYFPGLGVKHYDFKDNVYSVTVDGGTSINFNINMAWTLVDGNGSKLPQMFVTDQLPPGLLQYLQGTSLTDNVYAVSRDETAYRVTLDDTVFSYNIADGKITYPDGRFY